MTNSQISENVTRFVARGKLQSDAIYDLMHGRSVTNFLHVLRGNARQWSRSYSRSWEGMIERLELLGYTVKRTPGPRGGYYSQTISVNFGTEGF